MRRSEENLVTPVTAEISFYIAQNRKEIAQVLLMWNHVLLQPGSSI
jgi:hypothetical protein